MLKKAQVIMLQTENESRFHLFTGNKPGLYSYPEIVSAIPKNPYCVNQHLYIISDDEIKENDYCLNLETNTVFKIHKHGLPTSNRNKKIIATTDTSLNYIEHDDTVPYPKGVQIRLPQPSQQFITKYIEEYNKGNIIADVLVEYKRVFETVAKGMIGHPEDDISWWNEKLKINPNDNSITIKKLKDSWNREEVFAVITAFNNANIEAKNVVKWLEENL